jgi:hypothetical protein
MPILLKEISLNYTETDPKRLFWDYFAMYDLWRKVGSGHPTDMQTQRRMEIIDELFDIVQNRYAGAILADLMRSGIKVKESTDGDKNDGWGILNPKVSDKVTKLARQLLHARKMQNKEDMHSAISDLTTTGFGEGLLPQVGRQDIRTQQHISTTNPAGYLTKVSPIIARVFKSNLHFFIGHDKAKAAISSPPEVPTLAPSTPEPVVQAPAAPEPPPIPRPIVPPAPEKPMDEPMANNGLKRLTGAWENMLKTHGFEWDDINKTYEKGNGEAWISVFNNNSARLILKGGNRKDFQNLGLLFRHLEHEKQKQVAPVGAPVAQLNESNFKLLFGFLYS